MVLVRRLDIYALKPEVKPSKPACKAGENEENVKVMGEVPRETLSVSKVVNFYMNRKIRSTGISRDPALSAQFSQTDREIIEPQ